MHCFECSSHRASYKPLCHPGHSLVILNEVKDLLSALYKSPQSRPYDYFAVSWLLLWFLYKKKVFLKV